MRIVYIYVWILVAIVVDVDPQFIFCNHDDGMSAPCSWSFCVVDHLAWKLQLLLRFALLQSCSVHFCMFL